MSVPIQLWTQNGSGLILPCKSGIVYSHQTGGMCCLHPELEGAYVPLELKAIPHVGCMAWGSLQEDEADELDAYFKGNPHPWYEAFLRVDRTRLADSHEAWIWVVCAPVASEFHVLGSYSGPAVFTYENCD